MIRDLQKSGTETVELSTQVCIIGAGTGGIFLAQQLRRSGISVVMLEAGGEAARSPESANRACIQKGIRYRGAEHGRSFGLGGTSVLWGGQLIPVTRSDISARTDVGFDAWPIDYSELEGYFFDVKKQLGISGSNQVNDDELLRAHYPLLWKLDDDFDLRLSTWLPFRVRNISKAFEKELRSDPGLGVWLNSTVTKFFLSSQSDNPKITKVQATSPEGRRIIVEAKAVAICAGALESTRLMLELDESYDGLVTKAGAPLGRYFSDHLSVVCGRFECMDLRRYNLETAPIFSSGVMRTPRLELTGSAQRKMALTSAFAHFTFVTHGDTGFDIVRNVLRKRQGERQGLGLSAAKIGRIVHDVSSMAYWRGIHRRLWIPREADLLLQVDIEQVPNRHSRLSLADARDELGVKRLVIDWQITDDDIRVIRTMAKLTVKAWRNSPLGKIARLYKTLPETFDNFETLYDVYHPTGTLRMGKSASNSVVDSNLRVWGIENCFISSTAVFPSAGSANPGLTHLALTSRLADHIRKIIVEL